MNTSATTGAEQRLKDLGITLPAPATPFGSYAEAPRWSWKSFFEVTTENP